MICHEKFSTEVVYRQPTNNELRTIFPAFENPGLMDDRRREYIAVDVCKDISRATRKVSFRYVCTEQDSERSEVLALMQQYGMRPGMYEELIAFVQAYPDEPLKHDISALGSLSTHMSYPCAAYATHSSHVLDLKFGGTYRSTWEGYFRHLAVPLDVLAKQKPLTLERLF